MSKKEKEVIKSSEATAWFALVNLAHILTENPEILVKSTEFCRSLGTSQQTASRRLQNLDKMGWITRVKRFNVQKIEITEEGYHVIFQVFNKIKDIYEHFNIVGTLVTGANEGRYYVSIKGYYEQFKKKLGFEPYKGTLNLELTDHHYTILSQKLNSVKPIVIEGFKEQERSYGSVTSYLGDIYKLTNPNKRCKAAILRVERTFHKEHIVEVIAEPFLRDHLNIKDGDKIVIVLSNG